MNAATDRTRLGIDILAAGLALGVLADLAMRAWPLGLNVTLCTAALVAAGAALVVRSRIAMTADAPWLALTAVLLGVAFVRRAAPMLQFLDVVGILGTLALATLSAQGIDVRLRGLSEYIRTALLACASACVGALPLVFRDIGWAELPVLREDRLRRVGGIGLGIVLAFPLLFVFGGLFASADATFDGLVSSVLDLRFDRIASHTFLIGFWSVAAAGYLRGALLEPIHTAGSGPAPAVSLGIVPVGTALGLVNLLFLLFLAGQAPYLFGGIGVVERTTGLTLAQFARRGFFELVMVCALALPLLLGAEWTMRNAAAKDQRSFRALAGLLLLQVGAVMGSAVFRMKLYVDQFGPSQDRIYATAFMTYLALASGWFAWTVLRGARARFAFGAAVQGYAVLAALHLVNVDGMIVRANARRAETGATFDARYHARDLSADAVPALLDALPRLEPADRYAVARGLLERWAADPEPSDWRSWNWSTARARRLVSREAAALGAIPCATRSAVPPATPPPCRDAGPPAPHSE